MFSFTGNKKSFVGDMNFYGEAGVKFYTQMKTITARWKDDKEAGHSLSTAMPTSKNMWFYINLYILIIFNGYYW